jgi:hypothetical protein
MRPNESIRGDRRMERRYPVALELNYKVMEAGEIVGTGVGTTGNISSSGVFFLTGGIPVDGSSVEISIRWPAVSEETPFMQLRMSGRVVRSDAGGTALQISRYRFEKPDGCEADSEPALGTAMIQ